MRHLLITFAINTYNLFDYSQIIKNLVLLEPQTLTLLVLTFDFFRGPLSVRSLVLREVNLPGGVVTFFTWPESPLSTLKLGVIPPPIIEPETTVVSLGSVIANI